MVRVRVRVRFGVRVSVKLGLDGVVHVIYLAYLVFSSLLAFFT